MGAVPHPHALGYAGVPGTNGERMGRVGVKGSVGNG